jgi:hypothetical protein
MAAGGEVDDGADDGAGGSAGAVAGVEAGADGGVVVARGDAGEAALGGAGVCPLDGPTTTDGGFARDATSALPGACTRMRESSGLAVFATFALGAAVMVDGGLGNGLVDQAPTQAAMKTAATEARSRQASGATTSRAPMTDPSRPRRTTRILVPSTVTSGDPNAASAAEAPRRSNSAATASSLGQAAPDGDAVAVPAHSTVASTPSMPSYYPAPENVSSFGRQTV